jgi:hypothetical protein
LIGSFLKIAILFHDVVESIACTELDERVLVRGEPLESLDIEIMAVFGQDRTDEPAGVGFHPHQAPFANYAGADRHRAAVGVFIEFQ